MIVKRVTELIGNTPMLEIDKSVHGLKNINLFAKLELFNPFGSVKDKTAWNMLRHDLEEIKAKQQIVIESSSGNTAKAVQMICGIENIPFKIVTNRVRVKEVKQLLQLLGTEIEELPGQSQCLDPSDPNDPLFVVEKIMNSKPDRYFHTSQYTNELNTKAHADMTGLEIARDLPKVDYFIGGLGTTGSTRGAGETLKKQNQQLVNVGIVSSKNGFIPGIRNSDEMFEVGLFDRNFYDAVVEVTIDEALDGMMLLIKRCGILSGPTGGASLAGTLKYLKAIDQNLKEPCNAVFLVCDRVEWYLSFLQKLRPQWFGLSTRETGLRTLTEEQVNSVDEISSEELDKKITAGEPITLIDLRGGLAFKGSHIDTAINMPSDVLEELLQWSAPFSQSRPIVFVCPSGDQSKRFAALLSEAGFKCMSLRGGFASWREEARPVVKLRKHQLVKSSMLPA